MLTKNLLNYFSLKATKFHDDSVKNEKKTTWGRGGAKHLFRVKPLVLSRMNSICLPTCWAENCLILIVISLWKCIHFLKEVNRIQHLKLDRNLTVYSSLFKIHWRESDMPFLLFFLMKGHVKKHFNNKNLITVVIIIITNCNHNYLSIIVTSWSARRCTW